MDRHKSLYKGNSYALSPRQHKQMNRNAYRVKNRNDMFQSSRNIVDTPVPTRNEDMPDSPISATSTPLPMSGKKNMGQDANKENAKMIKQISFNQSNNASYASRIAMVATNCGDPKKLSRQEAFLKRFLLWKDVKKEEDMLKRQTKKPVFVPSGNSTVKNGKIGAVKKTMVTASFVPKNHPRHFQPPEGLQNPAAIDSNAPLPSDTSEKHRKSFYTVVPTPTKKKTTVEPSIKKAGPHSHFERFNTVFPIDRKATACTIPKANGFLSNKKIIPTTVTKEKATPTATAIKEKPTTTPGTTAITKTLPKSAGTKGTTETVTNSNSNTNKRKLILPPPPPPPRVVITRKTAGVAARIAKPISGGGGQSTSGACGKVKLLQTKRNDTLSKRPTQPHKNANLAVSLKAKKQTGGGTAAGAATAARTFRLMGKTLLKTTKESLPIAETPTDLANINPFGTFVTSTQFKSCTIESALTTKTGNDVTKAFGDLSDLVSPIEAVTGEPDTANLMLSPLVHKRPSSISAKRALLQNGGKRKDKLTSPKVNGNQRKFNFVYYSEVDSPVALSKRSMQLTEQQKLANVEASRNIIAIAPLTPSASKRVSNTTGSLIEQCIGEKGKVKSTSKVKTNQHKFNFVRHSEIVDSPMPPTAASQPQQLVQKKDELNLMEIVQDEAVVVQEIAVLENLNKTQSIVSIKEDCDTTIVNKEQNPVSHQALPTERTPPKEQNNSDRPANYLSPYVSVSRGKVSAKIEREKRNSIYLQTPPEETTAGSTEKDIEKKPPKTTAPAEEMVAENVELRRTIETVRYFRKQVSDQIARLHELCDHWEAYKKEDLTRLQETAGDDMINVTIGQTKLLTSKKFKQFLGLVDRCEAVAKGVAAGSPLVDDGSEATKLITVVDLEGFWSMVGLQIDNVEKRFENLNRWKANNWIDPDEVKVIAKNNLTKVKKAKINVVNAVSKTSAKPSSSLQQMLRKMQAEMRKNKATAAAASNTSNTLTDMNNIIKVSTPPSRKRRSHSGTPTSVQRRLASTTAGRISVIVRDRKSHSAAATVVSIPSPASSSSSSVTRRRSSLARSQRKLLNAASSPSLDSSINELRRSLTGLQKTYERNDLLKTALVGAANEQQRSKSIHAPNYVINTPQAPPRTPLASELSPPASNFSRKSILKTPGTAKGKPKNVIFNDKLRIKKFKFTLEGDHSDFDDDDDEIQRIKNSSNENLEHEESDQRTYSLRNRKVVLRPSSEFEIPKA